MRKIGLTLAAVAALATSPLSSFFADPGGRNVAMGFGVAAGVLGAAAAANAANNGYYSCQRWLLRRWFVCLLRQWSAILSTWLPSLLRCLVKKEPGAIRALSLSIAVRDSSSELAGMETQRSEPLFTVLGHGGPTWRPSELARERTPNNATSLSPVIPTAAIMAKAINPAMRPYSMAVAPPRRAETSSIHLILSCDRVLAPPSCSKYNQKRKIVCFFRG